MFSVHGYSIIHLGYRWTAAPYFSKKSIAGEQSRVPYPAVENIISNKVFHRKSLSQIRKFKHIRIFPTACAKLFEHFQPTIDIVFEQPDFFYEPTEFFSAKVLFKAKLFRQKLEKSAIVCYNSLVANFTFLPIAKGPAKP